ncbi:hypothetical protein [Janibacter sp. G56]|uniref:hypothetical protein n=1 Tax=Janibacter sp. G56 TaxID=3418717 RepID=UPI003CFE51EA
MSIGVVIIDPTAMSGGVRAWMGGEAAPVGLAPAADPTAVAAWVAARDLSHVVLLCRPADHRAARLTATVTSGANPRVAVATLAVPHSTVALAGAAMSVLEAGLAPGEAVAQLQQILSDTISGAWLPRVTKLRAPSPSFGQHVRSMLPGGRGHLALLGAKPVVVRADSGATIIGTEGTVLVGADAASPAFAGLTRALDRHEAHALPPVADPQRLYGADGAEFAILGAPRRLTPRPCPVCGEAVAGPACAFCRALLTEKPSDSRGSHTRVDGSPTPDHLTQKDMVS